MKDHWQYLRYVLRHKYYVWQGCRLMGLSFWIALIHDWSKFTPEEWGPYVQFFYNKNGTSKTDRKQDVYDWFNRAWNAHQKRNPHHWQYHLEVELNVCKCDFRSKTQNFANFADLNVLGKIFFTAGRFVNTVVSTTLNFVESITKRTVKEYGLGIENEMQKTEKVIENEPNKIRKGIEDLYWNIMEVPHRSALAVEKVRMNFSHWIIRKVEENPIEDKLANSLGEERIDGSLRMVSRQSFESFATIATVPTVFMGTVHITKTNILVREDGKARCLVCNRWVKADKIKPLPMTERYIREMVADWFGAGRAKGQHDLMSWYTGQRKNLRLHAKTAPIVDWMVKELWEKVKP